MAIVDDIKKQRGLTIECPSCSSAFRASDAKLFDATKTLRGDALAVLEALQDQLQNDRVELREKRLAATRKSETAARTSITAARAVHAMSARSGRCVAVNCGALPSNLVEAELSRRSRCATRMKANVKVPTKSVGYWPQ